MIEAFKKLVKKKDSDTMIEDIDVNANIEENKQPIRPNERRIQGKIIKISDAGWGFITSREIKFTRIFFHWTSLTQDTLNFQQLKTGLKVEFTPVEVEGKGWRANKIKVI